MDVDIDKSFVTKWLVNHLSNFGFLINHDKVLLIKKLVLLAL